MAIPVTQSGECSTAEPTGSESPARVAYLAHYMLPTQFRTCKTPDSQDLSLARLSPPTGDLLVACVY